jgi:glutamate/tyrosine decarboxylase-like PLP-dependent enzyme
MGKLVQRLGSLQAEQLSPAEFTRLLDVVLRQRRTLFGDPQMTVAVTGPGGEPLAAQVAEFVAMGAEQQRRAVQDMVDSVQRRLAAADGAVDDD